MINHILKEADEIHELRHHWLSHKKALWGIITSPFELWKACKEYLALPDNDLWWDSATLRGRLDLNERIFCVQDFYGRANWEILFASLAVLELDRRKTPDDASKEIIFCHYEPYNEESDGFDQAEADRHDQLAKEHAATRPQIDVAA